MKKTKKALASLAIAGMTLSMVPFNVFAADTVSARLSGTTAVQTAQAIAKDGWTTSTYAVLAPASSYNMVDALAAAPLAATLKAPVLLSGGDQLSAEAKAEITRLGVKTVYVTSGLAVIKAGVTAELQGMGVSVVNLGGFDQYETSVNIAKEIAKVSPVTSIFIANGETARVAQDALSVAAIAGAQKQPLLLTQKGQLPKVVADYLETIKANVKTSYITGGTGVVSDAVKAQLPGTVYRNAGNDAYDTNLAVLENFTTLNYDRVFVANGETMIDALAGAPLAAATSAPVVLVNGSVKTATTDFLKTKVTAGTVVTALGGTFVVPESVVEAIANPGQLNVTNVAGSTSSVYELTSGQVLEFTVDGVSKSIADLKAAGYTVEFNASADVFVGAEASSTDGVISANLAVGDLDNDKFMYDVTVYKGDTVVAQSASKRVSVKATTEGTDLIDSVELYLGQAADSPRPDGKGVVLVSSGKVALQDEDVYLDVRGNTEEEFENAQIDPSLLTYESSDPAIASVDADGKINLNGALGSVTITIETTNGETATKTFTVVDGKREVSKSKTVLTSTSVKIGKGLTERVGIAVKDQYGDAMKDYEVTFKLDGAVENADGEVIANAEFVGLGLAGTEARGLGYIDITSDADLYGTGTLRVRGADDEDLGTISVSTMAAASVSKYEIRNLPFKTDTVDAAPEVKGGQYQTTKMKFTLVNSSGYKVEDVDSEGDQYTLKLDGKTTENDYLDAAWADGEILLTAKKAGSVKLGIYEGSILRASKTITVVDSRPTITGVTYESNVPNIESTDVYKLSNVLKKSGIKVSGDRAVSYVANEDNPDTVLDIVTADGSTVGRIKLSVVQNSTDLAATFDGTSGILVDTDGASYVSGKIQISVFKVAGADNDKETYISSKTVVVDEVS